MSRFQLNFHGLISVDLDVSPRLERQVRTNLGMLILDACRGLDNADIVVRDCEDMSAAAVIGMIRGVKYQFAIIDYLGTEGLAILHQARPVAFVLPGPPLKLYLDSGSTKTGRIYLLLLYALSAALAASSSAHLLHGSCLAPGPDSEALLFIGRRGSCKTCLGLTLLKNGWQYIGDDKVILKSSRVHPVENWLGLRDWHLDKLPWLHELLPLPVQRQKNKTRRAIRNLIRRWGVNFLPDVLAAGWEARWNAKSHLGVERLFPGASELNVAKLKAVVCLRPASRVALRALSRPETRYRVQAAEEAIFAELAPLPAMMREYYGVMPSADRRQRLLDENLGSARCYELALPTTGSFEPIQQEALKCINQIYS